MKTYAEMIQHNCAMILEADKRTRAKEEAGGNMVQVRTATRKLLAILDGREPGDVENAVLLQAVRDLGEQIEKITQSFIQTCAEDSIFHDELKRYFETRNQFDSAMRGFIELSQKRN